MNKLIYLDFFKREAKKLFKEYKKSLEDDDYLPSSLVEMMIEKFRKNATLMNAQHMIAQSAGFEKWEKLVQATPEQLEDAKHNVEFDRNELCINMANGFIGGSRNMVRPIFKAIKAKEENGVTSTEILPLRDFSEEEQERILSEQPFERNKTEIVECLHCGRRFPFAEANVERTQDFDYIVCKYTPEDCDGNLMDLIPIQELDQFEE